MRQSYYILFNPAADINYLHLLAFHEIAEYREETKAFDTIRYTSIRELAERLNISSSTVSRILSNTKYSPFMEIDRINKAIYLKCSFSKELSKPFVRLTAEEVKIMKEYNDNLLCIYFIYLKYYCGFTKDKKTDFTSKQFLSACGYSTNSNSTLDRISRYNKLLTDKGIIMIEQYRDTLGHTRNNYSFL